MCLDSYMNEKLFKSLMASIVREHNAQVVCVFCENFYPANISVCPECNDYKGIISA
jgi:hypothetical protein